MWKVREGGKALLLVLESRLARPGSVRGHCVLCLRRPRAELLPARAAACTFASFTGGVGRGRGPHVWWVKVTPALHRPRRV